MFVTVLWLLIQTHMWRHTFEMVIGGYRRERREWWDTAVTLSIAKLYATRRVMCWAVRCLSCSGNDRKGLNTTKDLVVQKLHWTRYNWPTSLSAGTHFSPFTAWVLIQMILHDIFHHLLFSTSLSLSWCRWGHRWAGTLSLSSRNDSDVHFLSLGRTRQVKLKRCSSDIPCVFDEVWNETVQCSDGTVYLWLGLLKLRNIVEPQAIVALLAVTGKVLCWVSSFLFVIKIYTVIILFPFSEEMQILIQKLFSNSIYWINKWLLKTLVQVRELQAWCL